MAGSVNKVILIGNLGRDPEIRSMQTGKVAQLAVATSETWNDKNTGERKEQTEWHRVVIFNPRLVDVAEKMLQKGSKVYIEGNLRTRKWTGQDGKENYTTEIVLNQFRGEMTILGGMKPLDGQAGAAPSSSGYSQPSAASSPAPVDQPREEISVGSIGDDIPF